MLRGEGQDRIAEGLAHVCFRGEEVGGAGGVEDVFVGAVDAFVGIAVEQAVRGQPAHYQIEFPSLVNQIPNDFLKISESGISDPKTIVELRKAGFDGFLIGENFMKMSEPEKACVAFIEEVENNH